MNDRPAPTSPPPSAPPPNPPTGSPSSPNGAPGARPSGGPGAPPTSPPTRAPKPAKAPKPARPPRPPKNRDTTPPAPDGDTAIRGGFAERVQAKLASATQEHRANAAAPVQEPSKKSSRARGPRRARLRLTRVDPWSVMKTSFLLSIAFGIVTVVAVAMIWQVLGAAGVWDSINSTIREVLDDPGTADFNVEDYVGTERVLGFTMLVAAVDVVLLTAIATLGAFLYNMAAALLGGIEVTLAEDN